jgi:hypothetical protein
MSLAKISGLYLKSQQGGPHKRDQLDVSLTGVKNGRDCHPWKQFLIIPQATLDRFDITGQDLKVDAVIKSDFDLHTLPSGSVIKIGDVKIRLTFHCEPCAKIKHLGSVKRFSHHRGYHSQVLSAGQIKMGDSLSLLEEVYEPIPYRLSDRIQWYLAQNPKPIFAADLADRIGFSASYCRAIPRAIEHRDDIDKQLIIYKNKLVN